MRWIETNTNLVGYFLNLLVFIAVFTVLATSLDLLVGQMGLLSIAHSAFYGLGAYTSALLVTRAAAPFVIGVLAGMAVAGLVSSLISLPSLRLHDDHFVIATFGFQVIVFGILNNWMRLTGGPLGISAIPRPVIFGWHVESPLDFVVLATAFAGFGYLIVHLLVSSPFGRVLHVIREDETRARALGKNVIYFKIAAFTVSAALAAMAGGLYAHYITYIDPTSFTVMESILIISMVIVGGPGSLWGPLVGAFVLVTLPEALRFIGLPSASSANLRQIIYGSLLVAMIMFRPRGLVGKYSFAK
jgi:branched-chain amino acid transport system permease protein